MFIFSHFVIALLLSLATADTFPPDVRRLRTMFSKLNGVKWNRKGWGSSGDPCEEKWEGLSCTRAGQVSGLDLSRSNLRGKFPPEVFEFKHMEFLNLSGNALTGSLEGSDSWAQMKRLVSLDLSGNSLTGALPDEIELLSTLEVLDVSRSGLSLPLPEPLWDLPALRIVRAADNGIAMHFPEKAIAKAKNLETIDLSGNKLKGGIGSHIGKKLPKLKHLLLGRNELLHAIPPELGRLSKLESLDLSSNSLSGEVPDFFTDLSSLRFANFSRNQLSGAFPLSLVSKNTSLESVDLSMNLFSSLLPEAYDAARSELRINLEANPLSCPVTDTARTRFKARCRSTVDRDEL